MVIETVTIVRIVSAKVQNFTFSGIKGQLPRGGPIF